MICEGKVPLNSLDLKTYRNALLAERTQLANEDAASAEDRGTVTLDQQSVSRLSRMDALQRQAMANATMRRRVAQESMQHFGALMKANSDFARNVAKTSLKNASISTQGFPTLDLV